MRWLLVAVPTLVLGCAVADTLAQGRGQGTIVLYRDAQGVCQTSTTPFMRARRGVVRWKVDDEFDCVTGNLRVSLRFPAGPLAVCNGASGTRDIQCDLTKLKSAVSRTKYDVLFNGQVEDPEIQIEM
jgi:hypothetical protein